MNYIHRLQARIAELEAEVDAAKDRENDLVRYLSSDKFKGFDYRDGSLNNRVNVADVLSRLNRF